MPKVRHIPSTPSAAKEATDWLKYTLPMPSPTDQRLAELEKRLEALQQEAVISRLHASHEAESRREVSEVNRLLMSQMAEAKRWEQERSQRNVSDLIHAVTGGLQSWALSQPRKQKRSFSFTLALWKFYLRGEISS